MPPGCKQMKETSVPVSVWASERERETEKGSLRGTDHQWTKGKYGNIIVL